MELFAALMLGLVGSLHCAGMCGPLVLAISAAGGGMNRPMAKLAYHAGRLATYVMLGAIFGLLGRGIALAGMQRWLSVAGGAAILVGVAASSRFAVSTPLYKLVSTLKAAFARLLARRSWMSVTLLGGLNGLLPCGLVYAACVAAAATGSVTMGMASLLLFGLGTVPMMLTISIIGRRLGFDAARHFQRLAPACALLVGCLLVVRGMALGIPYLSPAMDAAGGCTHCHGH